MNPAELEQLLEDMLRRHGRALRLYAATWCQSPDDCVQRALIKLASQDPLPTSTLAWLFRVVRNEAIGQARSERRRRKRESATSALQPWFVSDASDGIDHESIESALKELPNEIREVVVAKIWSELTFEEIAEVVGCSASSVHRRFSKGINQLKQSLIEVWFHAK